MDEMLLLLVVVVAAVFGVTYHFAGNLSRVRDALAPGTPAPAGAANFFSLGMSFLLSLPLCMLLAGRTGLLGTPAAALRSMVLSLCLYSVVLCALLPALRVVCAPRVCAVLWAVPPMAYYIGWRLVRAPAYVLRLPAHTADRLLWIWLAGAAVTLLVPVGRHLLFSARMKRGLRPVTEERVRTLFEEEKQLFYERPPKRLRLYWCPNAPCPLALGVFKKRLLLPERSYTDEELRLIFRHELCHLLQDDAYNKLTMAVLRALCWFNPLLWLGTRAASEDLERAADEVALLGADGATRARYGALLLHTAAGETGFSTCLSAGARPLARRLREALTPRRRLTGGFVIAAMFLLVFFSMGLVQVSTDYGSAEDVVFAAFEGAEVDWVSTGEGDGVASVAERIVGADAAHALDYLRTLDVAAFYQGRDFAYDGGRSCTFFLSDGDGEKSLGYLTVEGDYLLYCPYLFSDDAGRSTLPTVCAVRGGVDWEKLDGLLTGGAA